MKKKTSILIMFLSVLYAMGITINLNLYNVDSDFLFFTEVSWFSRLVTDFYVSLEGNRIAIFALAVGIFMLLRYVADHPVNRRGRILSAALAIILALFDIIGLSFSRTNSSALLFASKMAFLKAVFKCMSFAGVLNAVFILLLYWIDRYQQSLRLSNHPILAPTIDQNIQTRSLVIKFALFFFIAWLPYFIIFYPGVSSSDTGTMILQFHQEPTWVLARTAVRGDEIFITNHHPVFLTLIYGLVVQLGLTIGNTSLAIGIFSILQMMITSLSFAIALAYFVSKTNLPVKLAKIFALCIGTFPPHALWSISMIKDTSFSICLLLFILLLIELVRTAGTAICSLKYSLSLFALSLLVMLTKNQGIYIVACVMLVFILTYKPQWLKILATIGSALLVFLIYLNVLLPALNIAPGGTQEALSVPFQQTARYVRDHGDEVTESEKEAIARILPYDQLAELYDPNLSDPVKDKFNQDSTKDDLIDYFRIWFAQLVKHPGTYIQATLNNSYDFFSTYRTEELVFYFFAANKRLVNYPLFQGYQIDAFENARNTVKAASQILQQVPLIGLYMSTGGINWFLLLGCMICIYLKRGKWLLAFLPALLSFAVCIASPSNGNLRYVTPIFYSLPLIAAVIFTPAPHCVTADSVPEPSRKAIMKEV